ncbi:hypothetical protein QBC39DRAFT_181275 [Podospora conica]|nr:hypothetical protein QBC39DRAFT_181275 [Schizothecium conicum]
MAAQTLFHWYPGAKLSLHRAIVGSRDALSVLLPISMGGLSSSTMASSKGLLVCRVPPVWMPVSAVCVGNHSSWTKLGVKYLMRFHSFHSCFLGSRSPLIGFRSNDPLGIGRSTMRSTAPRQTLVKWRELKHGSQPIPRMARLLAQAETTSLKSSAGQDAGGACPCSVGIRRSAVCEGIPRSYGTSRSTVSFVPQHERLDGVGTSRRDNGMWQRTMERGEGRQHGSSTLSHRGNLQSSICRGHPPGRHRRHIRLSVSDELES